MILLFDLTHYQPWADVLKSFLRLSFTLIMSVFIYNKFRGGNVMNAIIALLAGLMISFIANTFYFVTEIILITENLLPTDPLHGLFRP